MRTRTNLHIDNDALEFASVYANSRGISLGIAVSELIRRAKQMPDPTVGASSMVRRDEYGFLVVKASGPVITSEMVKEESEDDID